MRTDANLKQRGEAPASFSASDFDFLNQLVYTPAQFAALMHRHATWAYRRIYAGEVKVIRTGGRLIIPRSEIVAFLSRVHVYEGREEQPQHPQQSAMPR
jgi:hypothetical protein